MAADASGTSAIRPVPGPPGAAAQAPCDSRGLPGAPGLPCAPGVPGLSGIPGITGAPGRRTRASPQGTWGVTYGSRSSPSLVHRPAPGSQPSGAGNSRSRRSAGRHTPTHGRPAPPGPSMRKATAHASGVSTCPGCIANGVAPHRPADRRQSGNLTGRALPSTPHPNRSSPGASDRTSSRPLSGSASSSRSSLRSVICSSGLVSPPRRRSTTTVFVRPSSSRSSASSRPVRSSQLPPVQRPGTSATCWGTRTPPPNTSQTEVDRCPRPSAKAHRPPGAGGSSETSAWSMAPSGRSPVPGPAG